MEIEKNLVVSTCHVTQEDMRLLELEAQNMTRGLLVYSTDYWVLISVVDERHSSTNKNLSDFSKAFNKLYCFACEHTEGFTYLKLDADGPVLYGFDTFDW